MSQKIKYYPWLRQFGNKEGYPQVEDDEEEEEEEEEKWDGGEEEFKINDERPNIQEAPTSYSLLDEIYDYSSPKDSEDEGEVFLVQVGDRKFNVKSQRGLEKFNKERKKIMNPIRDDDEDVNEYMGRYGRNNQQRIDYYNKQNDINEREFLPKFRTNLFEKMAKVALTSDSQYIKQNLDQLENTKIPLRYKFGLLFPELYEQEKKRAAKNYNLKEEIALGSLINLYKQTSLSTNPFDANSPPRTYGITTPNPFLFDAYQTFGFDEDFGHSYKFHEILFDTFRELGPEDQTFWQDGQFLRLGRRDEILNKMEEKHKVNINRYIPDYIEVKDEMRKGKFFGFNVKDPNFRDYGFGDFLKELKKGQSALRTPFDDAEIYPPAKPVAPVLKEDKLYKGLPSLASLAYKSIPDVPLPYVMKNTLNKIKTQEKFLRGLPPPSNEDSLYALIRKQLGGPNYKDLQYDYDLVVPFIERKKRSEEVIPTASSDRASSNINKKRKRLSDEEEEEEEEEDEDPLQFKGGKGAKRKK